MPIGDFIFCKVHYKLAISANISTTGNSHNSPKKFTNAETNQKTEYENLEDAVESCGVSTVLLEQTGNFCDINQSHVEVMIEKTDEINVPSERSLTPQENLDVIVLQNDDKLL